ncbi:MULTISPECIES: ABC transporter ATP-binding protein [Brevibacillus]|jgi:oligopeptide/dipeptide ABC transporter ATP-binding protein|uniref:ABC transporter ATP-binding protein n=1 Tax=Brevibacillus TaxID=55080 RepID=UPI000EB95F59|nr:MULTISPECIES: dipeptide ABC transporter ATP-binding protein [Brevibacillus]MBU8715478.1 dipeptide ABC transporter ATP-binding protein [Brevibacillus parabrevis]MDH6352087.1 oligopeptide/dipeptide ABC transporter ATP-binding protein [Brevibacillus sp. 1238]MDR4999035.1 dipeptide ABC transporter ATP-binding protein [Brevibacillus parabrevis]MED2254412.1 dipeptide ABC transporter ATP-binding protein [Brevibacillus parabrevis]UED67348.1 dipeptide ABC transporter ATP-binding protein [Brevibacill
MRPEPLLEVKHLKKYYELKKGWFSPKQQVKAVDDVSFTVYRGETYGLVGESGCGKSTTGRAILRLQEANAGEIWFAGENVARLPYERMRRLRRRMQMVFQDPYASLNPKKTILQILTEPLRVHGLYSPDERVKKASEILKIVGLSDYHLHSYPHEFSGGQRQRIGIAKAVILQPDLIVADEPVSALDVSIQSQVINLLLQLQREFHLTYIFISHDLGVVRHITDRVGVMYLGKLVEQAQTEKLFQEPKHPYTQALLSAVPITHPDDTRERIILSGDVPSPLDPPQGCTFHPRCPACMEVCRTEKPPVVDLGEHIVACHLYA